MKAFVTEKKKREVDKIDSKQYLTHLIGQYQNLIFSICVKMTKDYFIAEDLTQETFLSAFRNLDSFDGKNEKAWLCRIASNKCIDYQKQAARRMVPSEETELEGFISAERGPEADYIEQEVYAGLQERCQKLKPPYDRIASLYFVEEQTAEEIAELTGKNLKTIWSQIYRARAMLRKMYGKERI